MNPRQPVLIITLVRILDKSHASIKFELRTDNGKAFSDEIILAVNDLIGVYDGCEELSDNVTWIPNSILDLDLEK